MVVKLSLRFFRGLLVAGSHRIADPKWPSPPQSGSSRTGFPAGICWHLSLPGNDYWQLHILSFCFFQTYQRIAPEKHCRQLLHVTSCKRLSGQKQVTEAWMSGWALKLSASNSKNDNLYAGCDVGCLYNTDNCVITIHELLSNAVFPLNSSMMTFKLRWKTDIYLKIWGSCEPSEIGLLNSLHLTASCCVILL